MRAIIDTGGFPEHLDGKELGRYIEVQVWSRDAPIFEQVRSLLTENTERGKVVTVKRSAR